MVGVVKDYHYGALTEKIGPQLFIMDPKYTYGLLIIKIKPENSSATLKHIESVVKKHHPFEPYQYQFKDEENVKQYEAENKWKQIISFAAMITIFISCIGLFGLATLSAEKRTKEIGIRKVLGASSSEMIRLLSSDFLKLTFIAAINRHAHCLVGHVYMAGELSLQDFYGARAFHTVHFIGRDHCIDNGEFPGG